MINLSDIVSESKLTTLNVETRSFSISKMFVEKSVTMLTQDPMEVNENYLRAAMLRIPLPTIYVHERRDGVTYDVLRGGDIIETFRAAVPQMTTSGDSAYLSSRILYTEIKAVIFRCSMSNEDVKEAMTYV